MRQGDNFAAARAELETFGFANVGIGAIDYNADGGGTDYAEKLERVIFRLGPKAYEVGKIEQTIRLVPSALLRCALVERFRPRRLESYPHLRDVLGELATIAPLVPAAWELCAAELEPLGCDDPACDCVAELARSVAPDVTPTLERLNARARGGGLLRVREQAAELLHDALAAYDSRRVERVKEARLERERAEDRELSALIASERQALGLAVA